MLDKADQEERTRRHIHTAPANFCLRQFFEVAQTRKSMSVPDSPELASLQKIPARQIAWRVEDIEAGSTDPAAAMNTTRIDADTSAMHRAEFRRPSPWRHNPFEVDPHAEALSCHPLATR